MNTIGLILPKSDAENTEEINILNEQVENIIPTNRDTEDVIPSAKNDDNSIACNKVMCHLQDVLSIKETEKCLDPRSPPSGNEKSSTPEWQYDGAGDGLAQVGSDEDTEPRDVWRVPKSLNELLNDASAIVPFQKFIQPDSKAYDMLLFWFACNGLQKIHGEGLAKFNESAEVIWIKFIRNHKVRISIDIFEFIKNNIGKCCLSRLLNAFTLAQQDIEKEMQYIFIKFCESDIYISWLFKQEDNYFHSSPDDVNFLARPLPTLHEDSELASQPDDKIPPRLSSKNLLLSAKYRDYDLNSISGSYERFPSNYIKHENPYHIGYTVGPTVSHLDSEIHSISSGAQTDDTYSFTDSSIDGSSKVRIHGRSRRDHHRMMQSAKMNQEPIGTSSALAVMCPGPWAKKTTERKPFKIEDCTFQLIKKLEIVKQERESKEKLEQSLLKMAQSENTTDQLRKLHAENSLPPNILADKLAEKVQQADSEPSQSILDDHVARVWDSPQSPGSPQPVKTKQLPHLNYFYSPKIPSRNYSTPKSLNAAHIVKYSALGAEGRVSYGKASSTSHHQIHNIGGRLLGMDVNSTISSDSGNVADYHDACERRIPKSRSMPEAMENNGANDSGSANRRLGCGSRRMSRRPPTENDSGVSVVSDSNFSPVGPYLPSDRISSWLNQSREYTSGEGTTHSAYQCDKQDCCKVKGTRSVHTVAGSTSPGTQRRNSIRRSPCSSSISGKTCYSVHQQTLSPNNTATFSDVSRNISTSQNFSTYGGDRRSRFSSSSSQCMQMYTSFDDQMSMSTLTKKPIKPVDTSSSSTYTPNKQMTAIVYNFQDDQWPFKKNVPTNCVTLRKFKEHLPKKGNYRYFFKKFCDDIGSVVFEEITDDSEIVPLFEGKIVSQIRKDE